MILGTAGHIDHGKTALVRALTGVDTDRLPEEKRRGITIDLGFAPLVLDGIGIVGIVDVPGHEAFVRTMLAGASGIDMAMLVVAADEGVMPQTSEHLEILSLLKIPRGIVAVTKSDLVDADWLALVLSEIRELTAGTMLDLAPVVPVSALTGAGIDTLKAGIASVASEGSQRADLGDDLFRLPIDRAFTVKGTGTVVTGTIWSGEVRRDDVLMVQPRGLEVRVRGIQCHGAPVERATPGRRAAIALGGCDVSDVERGSVLLRHPSWAGTRELDAVIDITDPEFISSPRMRLRFHLGTAETGARLARVRDAAAMAGPRAARIVLDEPIVARGGDRFILRLPSPARTVGGGEVVDPLPSSRRSAARRSLEGIAALPAADRGARAMYLIRSSGNRGIEVGLIAVRTGLPPRQVNALLESTDTVIAGDRIYSVESMEILESQIESAISAAVRNHPLEPGVSLQTIRAAIDAAPAVIAAALDRLTRGGRIERTGSLVRPAGWSPELNEGDVALRTAILHEICVTPAEPPGVSELEAKLGSKVRIMLRSLEREGKLERISDDRYYAADAVGGMIAAMRFRLEPGRVYSPAELKEVLGVSRKYLIPFLEFCDRRGITERRPQGRTVRLAASGGKVLSDGY